MATASVREALIQHLIHAPTIFALVGGRVYPKRIPEGESVPAITVTKVSNSYEKVHRERSISKTPRYQVVSWADSADAAESLAALIETVLDGFLGTLGYGTATMRVEAITIEGENDDDDEEIGLAWVNQDYAILVTP